MPVALLRPDGEPGFAPVARPRFLLGRDLDCDLVDAADGVADHHATLRYRRGEHLLKAEEGCALWMDGERLPLISLRDGDRVALAPDARPWIFRSRIEGSFWPPEIRLGEAWLSHPAFADPANGPRRFGNGVRIAGRDPNHCRVVRTATGKWVLKQLGPLRGPADANRYLRLLAALGGGPHPALSPLVDGGMAPREETPWRWMATRYVEGTCASALVEAGDLPVSRVLGILWSLADGLRHLHHRGVVHRNVAPDNVIVPSVGPAVLIDYGLAVSSEHAEVFSRGVLGAPGYVAPEVLWRGGAAVSAAIDAWGLAAVGYALLAGRSPEGENVRKVLRRFRKRPSARFDINVAAWEILESVLREGLATDPTQRPDLASFAQALEFAQAQALARDAR